MMNLNRTVYEDKQIKALCEKCRKFYSETDDFIIYAENIIIILTGICHRCGVQGTHIYKVQNAGVKSMEEYHDYSEEKYYIDNSV